MSNKKYEYVCRKCDFEGKFSKERIKCPDCGKMALVERELVQPLETSSPEKKKKTRLTSDGQPIFTGNTFVDDLSKFKEDMKFTKQVGFTVSPREKREPLLVKKNCDRCGKEFNSYDGQGYLCGKCAGAPR